MTEIEKSHIDGFGPLGTCGFIVLFWSARLVLIDASFTTGFSSEE
jgi:hypothetical protein